LEKKLKEKFGQVAGRERHTTGDEDIDDVIEESQLKMYDKRGDY